MPAQLTATGKAVSPMLLIDRLEAGAPGVLDPQVSSLPSAKSSQGNGTEVMESSSQVNWIIFLTRLELGKPCLEGSGHGNRFVIRLAD